MKKIILSALMLAGCLSLVSCSNEEKPLRTFELKENQTLTIDKYKFEFTYIPCFYVSYFDENAGIIDVNNPQWHESRLQSLPFSYTKVTINLYSTSITVSVNFDNVSLNKLFDEDSAYNLANYWALYSSKDESSACLGDGFIIDNNTNTFIYSPSSFDYSDYSLTFNSKTTPFELKEINK